MENINDLKVGETFQLGNRKLRLEEGSPDGCGNCFLYINCIECCSMQSHNVIPECKSKFRKDNKDIIFVEEEG